MSQVKIDFIVTGNMSSLHKQVQALNAQLMAVAGSMTAVDRSMSNLDLQAANAQFGRMLTSSGQFTQQMVTMKTSTDLFADSLSRQNLTMRQAFTEARNYVTRRGGLVRSLAKQQVMMQNSMVMPHGVSPTGRVTASVITPTGLDKNFATQMRVANKSWEIFNATAQQGATQMVNWGKNTQWAGRQLMVGFTVPLMIAGGLAAKTFKELDEELVRLQKVYGSGFTFGDDFKKQSMEIREAAIDMAHDMAQAYGQAGTETAALMADLAATGFEGQDLMRMTEQTTKLAALGEVDRQEAMKATVALQSAFKMSTDEVANSVLFLNAVENQTSASLQDLVEAIPRAGTVIKGLGGSVEDLALYMTAMREGGISAAEGANALKSGLSSIIAPPQAAVEFMKEFGINLPQIVQQNAGDLTGTIMEFQKELKGLDDLARQQVITKLFGKYQFARMSAFFENLGAQGSQTQKVLDLMGTSMEDLGKLADQEIGAQADSVSGKWKRAWEDFKVNIAVVGEDLLSLGTKVVNVFNSVFGFLAENEWLMTLVKYLGLAAAAIGPVIMLMGLFGNMLGMVTKGALRLINSFKVLTSGKGIARTFEMLTAESFQADSAVEQLTGSMYEQAKAQEVLSQGIRELAAAYNMLGAESMEASAGTAAATAAPARAALSGAAIRQTEHGLYAGNVRMARAHYIPRNPANEADRKFLEGIFGYSPGKGRSYNLQQFGYGLTSYEANKGASNTLPFFSGTMKGMTEQQAKAQVDITNYLETQAAKLKAAGVVDTKILAWKNKTLEAARLAAQSTAPRAAEAAFAISARDAALLGGAKTMQVNGKTVLADMTEGGNFKNYDDRVLAAQPKGLAQSWYAADGAMIQSMTEFSAALKAESAEMRKTLIARKRYGAMIDTAAKLYGDDAASLANDIPEERLNAAMGLMTKAAGDTAVKFELVQSELGTFLVAVNRAEGSIMGIAKQSGVGGAFKQLPGASVGKTPLDMSGASKTVLAVSAQMEKDARERAMIEKQIHQEAQKRLRAERQLATQRVATQKATLDILKQNMTYEQKVAQLRRQGLIDEEKGLILNKQGLTAEQLQTVQDFEQLAAEQAQTAQDQAQLRAGMMPNMTPASVSGKTGFMGGLGKIGSTIGRFATPAMMTAAMASMFLPESDNGAINVAKGAGTWAMMGSMLGPPGIVGGAIIGGFTETLNIIKKNNEEAAAAAAAQWEVQFGKVDISSELSSQLKLGQLDIFKAPNVDLSGVGAEVKSASAEFKANIAEGLKSEIEQVKSMTDEEAMDYAKRLYTNLVASGADTTKAMMTAREVLYQADKTTQGTMFPAEVVKIDNERKAEKIMVDQLKRITGAGARAMYDKMDEPGMLTVDEMSKVGTEGGKAYFNGLMDAFETGALDPDKFFQKQIQGYNQLTDTMSDGRLESAWAQISKSADAMAYLEEVFKKPITSLEEFNAAVAEMPNQDSFLQNLMNGTSLKGVGLSDQDINAFMDLGAATETVTTAQVEYLAQVRATNPEIDGAAQRLYDLGRAGSLEEATLMALADAQALYNAQLRENAMISDLVKMATPYVDDMPEKTNINQLQRQEDRKLEALRESEDARLEAMQEAADKRERLMEKEINQVERQYDKEIEQIQKAEEKRQEAFDNEQERAQRRQEMRNMEISYQEAIANGDLFEAARIRMDIAATKKQREAQSREEKRQEKADNKIGKLEKEKNQKLRILNKELRQEQRANEASLEAAQEASEKRIEMAEKESEKKIRAAEKANNEIEKDQRDTNDTLNEMMKAFLDGDRKTFRQKAKELGIDAKERAALISDWTAKQFEFLPDKLFNYLSKGIRTGNWDLLDELMKMTINGATDKEIKDRIDWQVSYDKDANPLTAATGGFVSGPGSGTSDSVPARLSNGEYVIKQSQVARLGKSFFDKINSGHNVGVPGKGGYGYASGGLVSPIIAGMLKTPMDMLKMARAAGIGSGKTDQFGGVKGAGSGDIVYWDGEPIDQLIAKQLRLAGKIAGSRFTVYQGSYQPQTSYSGTTHTNGGVIDTNGSGVFSPEVVALQKAGFAAWYRGPGAPGAAAAYPAHIHAVSLFSKNLDTNAAYQRDRYLAMSGDGISGPYYGPHVAPIAGLRTKLGLRRGGRINYDNTIANLHKGETVLTKGLTDKFEDRLANVGGNEYNFDVTIQGNVDSSVNLRREFERFVVAHEKKQQTRAGRSRRV